MSDKYPGNLIIGPSSGYSVYFNGVNSYLSFTKDLGLTTDFTVEFWLYPVVQATQGFYFMGQATGPFIYTDATNLRAGQQGAWLINPAYPLPFVNRWNHVALVRASGTLRMYVNGVSSASVSNTQNFGGSQAFGIGAENTGASIVNKEFYMSSLRVSNIARYSGTSTTSSNFGYPSLPYASDANTKFLSLQTATLIDQSASPVTITANGAAAVSNFYLPSYNPAQLDPALGAAVPGVWTLDEAAYYTQTKSWPVYDPSFKGTTLLLHGTGTNGAQNNTFLDSSANNFTITRSGNTTQGSLSPFSQTGWSNYFDGTGDALTTASNAAFNLTGDFTFECWIYPTTISGSDRGVFGTGTTDPNSNLIRIQAASSKLQFWLGGSNSGGPGAGTKTGIITCTTVLALNQWYHVAWVRSGSSTNNVKLYLNGVLDGQGTGTYSTGTNPCVVGATYPGSLTECFFGYISDARLVNGTAIYTAPFTPPTAPLTVVPNTSLLTCQANRFKDSSSNNFAITVNGTPLVQLYAPVNPLVAYTPSAIGGSGYFDGTSDYLQITGTAALVPDSVFTFEAWIYFGAIVSNEIIYSSTTTGQLLIGFNTTTSWGIGARAGAFLLTSTTLPIANQWNHIVACRGGTGTNQASLFLNGTRVANGTVSNAFNTTANYQVGYDGGSPTWSGLISGLRLVKSDVYGYTNTTITVPTAPPTAITNTALLLNFTNAGILDSTAKNNAETLADAKISTAVRKYGPSSMLFDGTGDYLLFPSSRNFELPGNFTIEFWMYPTSVSGEPAIFSIGDTDPNTSLIRISGTKLQFWIIGSTSGITTCNTVINVNTWYHVALVRSGSGTNNVKLYLNGVQDGVATKTAVIPVYPAVVARYGSTQDSGSFAGYISDLRVTKNIARYLANFTPPTSQLQDQ